MTLRIGTAAQAALLRRSKIAKAQRFVDGLKRGPNAQAAKRHLDAAKRAASDSACDKELGQVDRYSCRPAAADRRATTSFKLPAAARPRLRLACAARLHKARPGGSDYHGAPVPARPARR